MKIPDKYYDFLKWVAQYLLPALGTLYFALSTIWGLPYGEQVVGTVTALDAFLGVILGLSSVKYAGDGVLQIDTSNPEKDLYRLDIHTPLEELPNKKTVTLKVNPEFFATETVPE